MPPGCSVLDFELEVAAVVGTAGTDLAPETAADHVIGYTVLNDWSARDLQRREMRVTLGPAKGKDFATGLGPWLVTMDELAPNMKRTDKGASLGVLSLLSPVLVVFLRHPGCTFCREAVADLSRLRAEIDTMVGTLDYGPVRIATGTMGYKHRAADTEAVMASLLAPNWLLKIIPHVDGTARICELVEYRLEDVVLHGAWTGPAALTLAAHALAPVAELPVLEVVSGIHIVADLTLGLGKVVHDYLS